MNDKSKAAGTAIRTITLEGHFAPHSYIDAHAPQFKQPPLRQSSWLWRDKHLMRVFS